MIIYLDCKKGVYNHLITAMGNVSFRIINFFLRMTEPEVFYEKTCSEKFRNIHRKTLVLESL